MSTERRVAWAVIAVASVILMVLVAWVVIDRQTPPAWESPWGTLTPESEAP